MHGRQRPDDRPVAPQPQATAPPRGPPSSTATCTVPGWTPSCGSGPATPVVPTPQSAPARSRTPVAIASATSGWTAPTRSSRSAGTPSSDGLAVASRRRPRPPPALRTPRARRPGSTRPDRRSATPRPRRVCRRSTRAREHAGGERLVVLAADGGPQQLAGPVPRLRTSVRSSVPVNRTRTSPGEARYASRTPAGSAASRGSSRWATSDSPTTATRSCTGDQRGRRAGQPAQLGHDDVGQHRAHLRAGRPARRRPRVRRRAEPRPGAVPYALVERARRLRSLRLHVDGGRLDPAAVAVPAVEVGQQRRVLVRAGPRRSSASACLVRSSDVGPSPPVTTTASAVAQRRAQHVDDRVDVVTDLVAAHDLQAGVGEGPPGPGEVAVDDVAQQQLVADGDHRDPHVRTRPARRAVRSGAAPARGRRSRRR